MRNSPSVFFARRLQYFTIIFNEEIVTSQREKSKWSVIGVQRSDFRDMNNFVEIGCKMFYRSTRENTKLMDYHVIQFLQVPGETIFEDMKYIAQRAQIMEILTLSHT